jgi:glycosyltransferase involved in cell wall biosynthesis
MSAYISVIICTYNRASLLSRVLSSLSKQSLSLERFEVIVVNDGSTDDTSTVCNKMHIDIPNLRHISMQRNVGLAAARNRGIEEAVGEYILFTDDDCIPSGDWIERMGKTLETAKIVAGAVASTRANYVTLCHNIAQFHAFMPGRKAGPSEFIAGANMAFHRSVLKELGDFDKEAGAEDTEMVLRAHLRGYPVLFAPDVLVTHAPNRANLWDILRYAAVHAGATIHLRNRYRLLLNTPFIFRSPALIFAGAPVIALKVTAGIFLSNLSLLRYIYTAPVVYTLKLSWCWGAASSLKKKAKPIRSET